MSNAKLKSGWARVAFGDVVRLCTERSPDPEAAGFKRYVGLEHLTPGDLTIRRYGDVAAGTTFTSVFRPGQVLFAKRRAYQRKLGVPDFSGVCSGDIYVLESKNHRYLLRELLPFICQTDAFFEHAIGTSAGSLSPRTNWQSLATYEFALPPLEDQRRIVRALHASDDLSKALRLEHARFESIIDRFALDSYSNLLRRFGLTRATDFGEARMGRQKAPKYCKGVSPYPYLRVANVGRLQVQPDEIHEMDFTSTELRRFRLLDGDILITEGDLINPSNVGRPAVFQGEIKDCCFQNTLSRFRPNPDIPSLFALLLFEGARLSSVFAKVAKTTTVTHLGLGRFREALFPFPNVDTRRLLSSQLQLLLDSRRRLNRRFTASRRTTVGLLTRSLG